MWARFSSALRSTSSRYGLEDLSQQQEQVQERGKSQDQEQDRLSVNSLTTIMSKQSLGLQTRTFGLDMTNAVGYHRHPNADAISNASSRQGSSVDMDTTMNQSHTEVMNILTDMSDVNHDSSQDGHGGSGENDNDDGFSRKLESLFPPLPPIPSSFTQPILPPPPSPPPRRALFKRGNYSHKDPDSVRGYSGSLKLLPKKIRGSLPFGIGPQQPSSSRISMSSPTAEPIRGQSSQHQHEPRQSQESFRPTGNDNQVESPAAAVATTTPVENRTHASVRSILRAPKTPGTGQNVRFFPNDAFKVMGSPEESIGENFFSPFSQAEEDGDVYDPVAFVDRLNQLGSSHTSTPMSRVSSPVPAPRSRPALDGIFSTPADSVGGGDLDMSMSGPVEPPDFNANGSLDVDRLAAGMSFDVDSPVLDDDSAVDLDFLVTGVVDSDEGKMMSTPFIKPGTKNGKREEKEREQEKKKKKKKEQRAVTPTDEDETIFHSMEQKPVFSPPLHERSQSFSFGQTVFQSMNKKTPSPRDDKTDSLGNGSGHASFSAGESRRRSGGGGRRYHHHRASSDTVFQPTLRASSPTLEKKPEIVIHSKSSADLQSYTSATEPDPFNANANTYYTPQTMIPTTPPAGAPRHVRKTSKEENLIYSLQAQLTLQTEICSQFEADLRAKDEMVELLGKRLTDMEKQENQRKSALRQWKNKVQELERAVRILEEEVDTSRQESMERSVMDEASGEALRMLHRQIAGLEKEKKDWEDREKVMMNQIGTLEVLMKQRLTEVANLKEILWKKDESEKELVDRLKEAREEIDTLGNVSLGGVDEDELRRLTEEREVKVQEERRAHRVAEMNWEQEKAELVVKLESMQVEKTQVAEQLHTLRQEFKIKNEEYDIMKSELEAQWKHTEAASDKMRDLQQARKRVEEEITRTRREKEEVAQERDELAQRCDEVEQRANHLEKDWNESENRKHEIECELHELWDEKEDLEKEHGKLEEKLSQERDRIGGLMNAIKQFEDRIAQLERERQSTSETVVRLENGIHQRDEEIGHHTERIRAQKIQVENLRDEMSDLKREYEHVVADLNEHARALSQATESKSGMGRQLEDLASQKADVDADLKSHQERNEWLESETERLKKQVHDMQQESADRDIKVIQLTKQHGQDKEDIQGLNIALDAKQQELELYKRKAGIKSSSHISASSSSSALKNPHRRNSSSLFDGTPTAARPPSRAASVVSESESNKGEKISVLSGKSSRVNTFDNGTSATGSALKIGKREGSVVIGSMRHPPPPRKRLSLTSATPTPASRPGVVASRAVKSPTGMVAPVRRVPGRMENRASVISPTPSIPEESSDKENVTSPESDRTVRRSIAPIPL